MKNYKFLSLFIALFLIGCTDAPTANKRKPSEKIDDVFVGKIKATDGYEKNVYIVEIEGCEYLKWQNAITHKGNCKYCSQRSQYSIYGK